MADNEVIDLLRKVSEEQISRLVRELKDERELNRKLYVTIAHLQMGVGCAVGLAHQVNEDAGEDEASRSASVSLQQEVICEQQGKAERLLGGIVQLVPS